jgi:hypothetical protein
VKQAESAVLELYQLTGKALAPPSSEQAGGHEKAFCYAGWQHSQRPCTCNHAVWLVTTLMQVTSSEVMTILYRWCGLSDQGKF